MNLKKKQKIVGVLRFSELGGGGLCFFALGEEGSPVFSGFSIFLFIRDIMDYGWPSTNLDLPYKH